MVFLNRSSIWLLIHETKYGPQQILILTRQDAYLLRFLLSHHLLLLMVAHQQLFS